MPIATHERVSRRAASKNWQKDTLLESSDITGLATGLVMPAAVVSRKAASWAHLLTHS
jgi:hypothetical protein